MVGTPIIRPQVRERMENALRFYSQRRPLAKSCGIYGAEERTRTSTPLRALDPEFTPNFYLREFALGYIAGVAP